MLHKHRDCEKAHKRSSYFTDSKSILEALILRFEGRHEFLSLVNLLSHYFYWLCNISNTKNGFYHILKRR